MKVIKYGTVTFAEGPVKVDDWLIQRESEDPKDATDEQLLLAYAIYWAEEKFTKAKTNATIALLQKVIREKLAKAKADADAKAN